MSEKRNLHKVAPNPAQSRQKSNQVQSRQRPNQAQNKQNPNRKKKLFLKTFAITIGVLALVLIAGVIAFKLTVKPPEIPNDNYADTEGAFIEGEWNKDDSKPGGSSAPAGFTSEDRKEDFYTFLIIGTDKGVNTDTIMVASYDGINKTANLISIPRDSLVSVNRKTKKINAAYSSGTLNGGGRDGGIAQLKKEVKTIIGFEPDFYIMIDLKAFVRIVDAVEGIDVNVPFNMRYYDPTQSLNINIPKGEQHLDGEQALKFARYRNGSGGSPTISDYARIENQQTVIYAILERLLKPASLLKIPEFIDIFNENVYSDITAGNMVWLADQLREIRGTDALSTYTIPTTGTSGLPNYYELLDETGIVELVNKTINPYTKNIEAKDLVIISSW